MKRGGLTLPEVMLAMAFLAIVLVSLVSLFGRGLQLQRKSTILVQATQAGQRELEAVRDLPFDQLPASASTFDGRTPDPPLATFPPPPYPAQAEPGRSFPLLVRVEPYETTMRRVTVEVFYDGGTVLLETLIHP